MKNRTPFISTRNFVAALGIFLVAGSQAQAAEPANWTGFHLGIGGGFGMLDHQIDAHFDDGGLPPSTLDATFDGIGGHSVFPTIEAGFDYQLNANYVAGIQADTNTKGYSVLGRVGRLVDGSSLLYVIGGWSHDDFLGDLNTMNNVNVPFASPANGFTIGSGIETALSDHVTAKLEYRLTRYGAVNLTNIPSSLVTTSAQEQTVRAVISYHFGNVHPYRGEFNGNEWTGFHVGLGAGAGMIDHKIDLSGIGGSGIPNTFNGIGGKGFLGTAEAGYDYQLGNRLVIGLQGDYTLSNVKSSVKGTANDIFNGNSGSLEASLQASNSYSLLARLGVLSSPHVLWYGIGGYTHTNFDLGYALVDNTGPNSDSDSTTTGVDGLTAGVGFESMLGKNWSWKTEYRFTSLNKPDILGSIPVTSGLQSVRSVLSYRF